ncbi:hypothetical protein AXK11_08635 [Cephaloticoccus primus]|uniref:Lipoprotein n=1 Tax=Cephaloticoccus primus TaxID=1548207 RepID=A0A139SIK0_9BACT|nr:GNA1162 family protein [Cephaloticoccus primus]KXU34366.1 hypothetical protein AXK11_08635 [Cephaloticoccus primus]
MKRGLLATFLGAVVLFAGCVSPPDYTAFREHRPSSILILPPVNGSVDVKAMPAVLSASVKPLAEAGYYVVPVTNMMEVFYQNGLTEAVDIQAVPPEKLIEFFGADAALYIEIEKYGARYMVINSVVEITAAARLVDLRTGTLLWENRVQESISTTSSSGLLGALVESVVQQIVNTVTDRAWPASQQALHKLYLHPQRAVLPGPRLDPEGKAGRSR